MKRKAVQIFVSRVTVYLTSVPFDMLRYDSCVPDTEADAHKLERLNNNTESPDDRTVTFRRYAMTAAPPTEDRWHGFGGRIISWEPVQ